MYQHCQYKWDFFLKDGLAACIHFNVGTGNANLDKANNRVLMLFYREEKKSFAGFIPTEQVR